MAINHWDPFRDAVSLRDAMNSLFQDSFVRPNAAPGASGTTLPVDVQENENEYIVHASLPGVKPDEVQITVHGDTLTIRAETKTEEEKQGNNWLVRERRAGAFQRTLGFNAPVSADRAVAQFEHGVLTLTLPKAEEAKPKQIKIGGQAKS